VIDRFDSRRLGATGTFSRSFILPAKGATIDSYAVAPGLLQVSVNGKPVDELSSWTYAGSGSADLDLSTKSLAEYGIRVEPGQRIMVTVRATHFADPAWVLRVRERR
jgi:hypothetical protein